MSCQHIYSRAILQEYPRLCINCGEPETYKQETMHFTNTDNPVDFPQAKTAQGPSRFDLEQQILECWKITDDIATLEQQGAGPADFTSLANVYEFKFEQLWQTFETLVRERKL